MNDLTEQSLEIALREIRALTGDKPIGIKPTKIMLSPQVIEYFGDAETAVEVARAVMKDKGYT